ncbi:fatty acid desaturase [Anabaenopsis elenkinii CCIBt3563]|jgi:beta-carotene ketolase (CrtW type)|uniref:Fatty acid desaturase n=2 Tax=Anabaenopsis elenkinii CCIBt3563 TaxID=2779889 RepID=A0A7U3NLM3_9CYAN|nr:fatty acid desaturase [Anabaenopsis elenkinii CCIBt3563]
MNYTRSKSVFQLEPLPLPDKKISTTAAVSSKFLFRGIFVAIAIMTIWAISLGVLLYIDISQWKIWLLLPIILWQTFLYTGLFITAHDAMHGVVFPKNLKINHFIGSLCLFLYGLLSYPKLLKKHWLHHHNPATAKDPDFHNGKYKNFLAWYLYFMKGYWSWWQIITLMIIYNLGKYLGHLPEDNLNYFWVIPSILSSLQLFYFGTFLPHSEPVEGYQDPHRSQTISRPIWWSFITCYHFGYHYEHHEYPHVPWWQLPQIYQVFNSGNGGRTDK